MSSSSAADATVAAADPLIVADDSEEEQDMPIRTRAAPVMEQEPGKAIAAKAASTVQEVSEAVGAVTAATVTHEVRSRVIKPAAGATPDSLAASQAAHKSSVAAAASGGKAVGGAAGRGLGTVITQVARRVGAHQCDNCGAKNLYDYMKCTDAACQKDDAVLGTQAGYDLCYACHDKFKTGKASFHPASHQFEEHKNGIYTIKMIGVAVAALVVARWFFGKLL